MQGKSSSTSQLKVLLFKLATLSASRSDIIVLHNRAQRLHLASYYTRRCINPSRIREKHRQLGKISTFSIAHELIIFNMFDGYFPFRKKMINTVNKKIFWVSKLYYKCFKIIKLICRNQSVLYLIKYLNFLYILHTCFTYNILYIKNLVFIKPKIIWKTLYDYNVNKIIPLTLN